MTRSIAAVPAPEAGLMVETTRLFVRGLEVMASIGVYPQEKQAPQRLVIDVDMDIAPVDSDSIGATFDYDHVRTAVEAVIAQGHHDLIETFARHVGERLFALGALRALRIRIEKPAALAPYAQAAGVELCLRAR
ncbi:dihydroneopterin aldolase [Novosphingobium nitrogenifigens DSM 19370]|uniref:7,8-dihydroneopterin aldolase n=1 Tax=Novosphingobium nitrogenifigens DSM 19370 TaxID=983920 RepID=F1Z7C9_9SPHN|nr:dihydroneopterin aldolase [Novosphingobium nitrogenifigens]EGD59441.1 dihydroneopterin aldolase [Novosphingobium nitrogenifigens DSM 19370]